MGNVVPSIEHPELVRVIPVPIKRRSPKAGLLFTSVEYWTTHVVLVFGNVLAEQGPSDLSLSGWHLEDDLGTTYHLFGGGFGSDRNMERGHVSFWPAAPMEASALRLTVDPDSKGEPEVIFSLHVPP